MTTSEKAIPKTAVASAMQVASNMALRALLDAYKPNPDGSITPTIDLLTRYQNASAMLLVAEQALIAFAASGAIKRARESTAEVQVSQSRGCSVGIYC